jgi:hypothetical protein
MKTIILRPADPERDFGQLADWFSILEGEPNSESGVKEYFDKEREKPSRGWRKMSKDSFWVSTGSIAEGP